MHNKILTFALCSLLLSVACSPQKKEAMQVEWGAVSEVVSIDEELNSFDDAYDLNEAYEEGPFAQLGTVGQGIVNILHYLESKDGLDPKYFEEVFIYNDPKCLKLYCSYLHNGGPDVRMEGNLVPVFISDSYLGYHCYILLEEGESSYKIAINKKETKYIKKEEQVVAQSWETFFNNVFLIAPTGRNPLRVAPDDNAEIAKIEFDCADAESDINCEFIDSFKKIKVDGDWLNITYQKAKADNNQAWIRWKNNNNIMINIYISI